MNHLGRALTEYNDPPVKVLFVYNCNPAATVPDQQRILRGLERDDLFTVVFEQVMTDTALYADVVLPNTTFLEGYDFAKAYGPHHLELGRPVVDAVGESRSNADVFGELCARLGLLKERRADRRARSDASRARRACRARSATDLRAGARADRRRSGSRRFSSSMCFRTRPIERSISSPRRSTPSAPIGLYRFQPDPATERYPLALISPASERTISSTLGELPRPDVKLLMHPDDAQERGLAEGDLVRIFNELGEVHCPLHGRAVRSGRGTVSLPKGLWRRSTRNGSTGTALVPDTLTDLGGGACFNDARVQVASLANS